MSETVHTPWHVNDARTVEGDCMICSGEGHGYGMIATAADRDDAHTIVRNHNDRPTLLVRVAELEAALRPFAEMADVAGGSCDHDKLWESLTAGDFRRSRAALSTTERGGA